ncbi:hypothetical protein [Streptomyces sp. NPDC089919]|uniref:hypothetical protein n=1 Tax=Streptomyces sp. NPDC089919 TaxID=3155188 RepID=UPI003442296F
MTSERTDERGSAEPQVAQERRRPRAAVLAVAAAVLLAGGGGAFWAATAADGGAATASKAALGEDAQAVGRGDATPPKGIAVGEPDPTGGGVRYVAKGTLPAGPGTAPGYAVTGEVTKAEVARLAAALGLAGEPVLSGGQWQAGVVKDAGGPRLTVARQAPGAWTFTAYQRGGDNCKKGTDQCGPATLPEGGAGTPVDGAAARAAAAPVLKAAGQDAAKLDTSQVQGAQRVVNADPVIGGLPTSGWRTTVLVGADGKVTGGTGNLKAPVKGGQESVISAGQALNRLNASTLGRAAADCAVPVPDEAGTGVTDDGAPDPGHGAATGAEGRGSGPDGPTAADPQQPGAATSPCDPSARPKQPRTETVEGAVLGLTPRSDDKGSRLVPAWLFSVAGRDGLAGHTVAQPALASEEPAGTLPSVPGFSYQEAGRKLTVHFWGGVCSTYRAEVRESSAAVRVTIVDTPRDPGRACILIAQDMSVTVTLQQPLGGRKVIDATSGETLPHSR